jgi:hypothetical protein
MHTARLALAIIPLALAAECQGHGRGERGTEQRRPVDVAAHGGPGRVGRDGLARCGPVGAHGGGQLPLPYSSPMIVWAITVAGGRPSGDGASDAQTTTVTPRSGSCPANELYPGSSPVWP